MLSKWALSIYLYNELIIIMSIFVVVVVELNYIQLSATL